MTTKTCMVLTAALLLAWASLALAADPVGVLTEIRGQVEVKRAGEGKWTAAQPLLALRPGDQLRATGDAHAALVFTGGHGAQAVSVASLDYVYTGDNPLYAILAAELTRPAP